MQTVRLTAIILGIGFISLDLALAYVLTADAPGRFPATATLFLLNGLAVVAATLFLMGVQGFKPQFKKAYYYICIGYLFHAFGSLSYPIAFLGHMDHVQNMLTGDLPLFIGSVFIYFGIRKFGQLVGLTGWAMDFWKFLPIWALVVAVAWFLPHRDVPTTDLIFDLNRAMSWLEAFCYLLAALVAFRIRHIASVFYARPLLWFGITFMIYGVSSFAINVQFYLTSLGGSLLYIVAALGGVLFLSRGVFSIIAGYSFNKMNYTDKKPSEKEANVLDVIIFTASLASRPREIDPILDDVREITAVHERSQALTDQEIAALSEVYARLEDYLVTKETIRNFTRESLRQLLQKEFQTLPSFKKS